MKHFTRKFALGATLAAIVGYIAGILTAPKSGKQTRKDIKNTADDAVAKAEKELKALHTELDQLLEQVKQNTQSLKGKAKTKLDILMQNSQQAKQKTREILSSLHDGVANDKDLNLAISEASKAVKHLKMYLAKHG